MLVFSRFSSQILTFCKMMKFMPAKQEIVDVLNKMCYNVKIKCANLLTVKKILIVIAGPLVNAIIVICTMIYYKVTGVSRFVL